MLQVGVGLTRAAKRAAERSLVDMPSRMSRKVRNGGAFSAYTGVNTNSCLHTCRVGAHMGAAHAPGDGWERGKF